MPGATGQPQDSGGLVEGLKTVTDALGSVAQSLTGLVTNILPRLSSALTGLAGVFDRQVGRISSFVEALNPAQMFQFGLALRDLQATIGSAFEGVIDVFIGLARDVASALMPAMDALRPALTAIAQAFAAILVPIVKIFAAVLEGVAPIIQFIGELFQAFAPVLEALAVVARALWQTIGALLSSLNAGGILGTIANFFKKVAETIILVMASVAKAFGATGFIDKLIANLQPEKGGQKAAIRGVGIHGFEDIARQMATLSAAAAGGGAAVKPQDQLDRERMIKELEAIRDGKGNEVLKFIATTVKAILDFLKSPIKKLDEVVFDPWRDVFDRRKPPPPQGGEGAFRSRFAGGFGGGGGGGGGGAF